MISAYKEPLTRKLVVVAINASNTERKYKLELRGKLKNGKLTPYVTSENANLQKGENVNSDEIILAPKSVVTLTGEIE